MHTLRKAKLTFGLVTVDVRVATAVRKDSDSIFTSVHTTCKTRLTKPYYCTTCETVVPTDEQQVGFPVSKTEVIALSPEELEAVKPVRANSIDLEKFIEGVELNDVIKDTPYWLTPDDHTEASKGYVLLWEAMIARNELALGMITLWGTEHPVCVEAREGGLMMWTLHQMDAVVIPDFVIPSLTELAQRKAVQSGNPITPNDAQGIATRELEQAGLLLAGYEGGISPSDFERPFRDRLRALIERKMQGKELIAVESIEPKSVPDVMVAIRDSIKAAPKKASVRRAKVRA